MIVVIGAGGTVGREVVAGLRGRGHAVRAFVRDAGRASFGAGVEVAVGDLSRPETVRAAMAGADAVFVLTVGPDAATQEAVVAEEVRRGGVGRIVKLSSVAADDPALGSYGRAHAEAERAFTRTGAAFTALRAAAFMSNVLQWRASIAAEDTVYQTYGHIPRAVIDPADVAAAAVVCLTAAGHDGQVYRLTGPEALTAPQQATRIATLLGRPLGYVEAPREAAAEAMTGGGLPAGFAAGLLDAQADPDPCRGGLPLPTVRNLTGREPAGFDAWLSRHGHLFTTG